MKLMFISGRDPIRKPGGYIAAQQQNYGQHFDAINRRLRYLGLRTFTPEEIRRQIAQAEIDAYFRNDPNAAISASKRLGASAKSAAANTRGVQLPRRDGRSIAQCLSATLGRSSRKGLHS